MGIYALIPVQETFHINGLADFQRLYSLVYIGCFVTQVGFHGEGLGFSIIGNVEI